MDKTQKIDIIKSKISKAIIEKIENGDKKDVTARDCLTSLTQLHNISELYTAENKKTLTNILTTILHFEENEIDFNVVINANIKNQINELINKVINIDNVITHNQFKAILKLALISCFGFKFENRDKTTNLKSWIVKRKNITINAFVVAFLQSYCFTLQKQIVNINNDVFIVGIEDFNKIKNHAYTTYNNTILEGLNK